MIIAIIPAKGQSRRLPNKNMQEISGNPMIYYSIDIAQNSKLINDIYISTDSDEIDDYAESLCCRVIRRGYDLSNSGAPVLSVYTHALEQINDPSIKYVVGIQPDHPDRTIDIDEVINYTIKKGWDQLLTVDEHGYKNGSLWIIKVEALKKGLIGHGSVGSSMDGSTNIHYQSDLEIARHRKRNTCI